MKKLIKNYWIISVVIILVGCNKNDGYRIWEGRALEYGSHRPIGNAKLYLLQGRSEQPWMPASFEIIDSTTTPDNGTFKFKHEFGAYTYKIIAKAKNYYVAEVRDGGTHRSGLKKDIELDPYAWLRLHIKNVNPVDENDIISFESFSCTLKAINGINIDTFSICTYRGNRTAKLFYNTFKTGHGPNRTFIEYTLGAHDTTDYLLEF